MAINSQINSNDSDKKAEKYHLKSKATPWKHCNDQNYAEKFPYLINEQSTSAL